MDKDVIYLGEIEQQIHYAKMCFDSYKKARQSNDIQLVFFHVHHFVVHAINVNKLLYPENINNPRKKLLEKYFDLRSIDLDEFRKLRNHLEHFDSRLDDWVSDYEGNAFFDMNLVDGTKGFPEKAFLRAMDGDTFKFYGKSYNLTKLINQLLEIEKQIPEIT